MGKIEHIEIVLEHASETISYKASWRKNVIFRAPLVDETSLEGRTGVFLQCRSFWAHPKGGVDDVEQKARMSDFRGSPPKQHLAKTTKV